MIWNTKIIALTATSILLAGSAVYAYNKGRQSGMQEVQTLWDSERLATQAAQAEELMKARQTEQALQKAINRIRQEKQREATRLVNDYAAVINSLHERPDRPAEGAAGVPKGADAGTRPATGCTGAQLYKPYAAILAGEALRADQLRIALNTCIEAYNQTRREINGE